MAEQDPNKQPPLDKTLVDQDQPKAAKPIQFGRYQIVKELARGGMGIVYIAKSMDLEMLVALKVLKQQEEISPKLRERFLREARLASRLNHPNIVRILDCGVEMSMDYIVMDYIEGEDLGKRLWREGPIDPLETIKILKQVCEAIHFAHTNQIVHRDLKTANILLTQKGIPMVTDFGIAKDLGSDLSLTRTGAVMGSPGYMSPEQVKGDPITIATDIYALGVILFEMLTAQLPYQAPTVPLVYNKILMDPPPSPREINPKVPPQLVQICQRAMAKELHRRYPTALAMAQDLTSLVVAKGSTTVSGVTKQTPSPDTMKKRAPSGMPKKGVLPGIAKKTSLRSHRPAPEEKSSKNTLIFVGALVFLGVNLAIFLFLGFWRKNTSPPPKKGSGKTAQTTPTDLNKKSEGLYTQAKALYLPGKFQQALEKTDQALQLKKNWSEALLLKAKCLAALGSLRKTREILKGLPASIQKSKDFQVLKARLALIKKNGSQAEALLTPWRSQEDPEIKFCLSLLESLKQNYSQALQHIIEALKKFPERIDWLQQRAFCYYLKGDYKSCLEGSTRGIFLYPGSFRFHELRGLAYLKTRNFRDAKANLEKALDLFQKAPYSSDREFLRHLLYYELGKANFYLKNFGEARENFSRTLQDSDPHTQNSAYYWLGMTLENLNMTREALENYRQGIAQNPKIAESLYMRIANLYYQSKQYPEALKWATEGLKYAPKNRELLTFQCRTAMYTNKYSLSISAASQLIQLGLSLELAYELRGECYYFLGKKKESLRDYDRAFLYGMKCHLCLEKRAGLLLAARRYSEVPQNTQRLIETDPQCFYARYTGGVAYYYLQKYPEAIQKLNDALQINSQYTAAYYYRGHSYYQTRQYSLARKDFSYVAAYSRQKNFTDSAKKMLEKLKGMH